MTTSVQKPPPASKQDREPAFRKGNKVRFIKGVSARLVNGRFSGAYSALPAPKPDQFVAFGTLGTISHFEGELLIVRFDGFACLHAFDSIDQLTCLEPVEDKPV